MAKQAKEIFVCSACDNQSPKWSGRCLECGAWGTLSATQPKQPGGVEPSKSFSKDALVSFDSISAKDYDRLSTGIAELDRVFGGGIVPGSLSLLGGEPGIGKSTIVLQIAQAINKPVLYASGEESARQLKLRVERLSLTLDNVSFIAENSIEQITGAIKGIKPGLVIVDSIQTLYAANMSSDAGSINQVRACTVALLEMAKKHDIPILIIGHVTKDGQVAGPKTLEHLVDTVLYLERSPQDQFRILRSAKNRFGSTDEIGVFEMTASGLHAVTQTASLFYQPSETPYSGTSITCVLDGIRPFIIEIQALITKTQFGYPQRKAAGYELNRLQMLLAVLTKRMRLPFDAHDAHLNLVSGYRTKETAADLAVCCALLSSLEDIIPKGKVLVVGEVGLGGEIRPVPQLERRVEEARRLGFTHAITPVSPTKSSGIKILQSKTVTEAWEQYRSLA